jgi:glycerol-3-phosphate O-acyltransferase/dihydroxyacetone phosphate acyltransferase
VANHPNTLDGPLAGRIRAGEATQVGFVANAGLFSNRMASLRFFRYFHVIPIFRRKDVAPGEQARQHPGLRPMPRLPRNRAAPSSSSPKGSSHYEINLREIRTGTARIALELRRVPVSCASRPIALDYSDAIQFRSMVRLTVGRPIMRLGRTAQRAMLGTRPRRWRP